METPETEEKLPFYEKLNAVQERFPKNKIMIGVDYLLSVKVGFVEHCLDMLCSNMVLVTAMTIVRGASSLARTLPAQSMP